MVDQATDRIESLREETTPALSRRSQFPPLVPHPAFGHSLPCPREREVSFPRWSLTRPSATLSRAHGRGRRPSPLPVRQTGPGEGETSDVAMPFNASSGRTLSAPSQCPARSQAIQACRGGAGTTLAESQSGRQGVGTKRPHPDSARLMPGISRWRPALRPSAPGNWRWRACIAPTQTPRDRRNVSGSDCL